MWKSFILLMLLAGPAFAADDYCTLAFSPQVPDGRTADETGMRIGREQMQAFIKKADEFLHCIEQAEAEAKAEIDSRKSPTADQMAVYKVRKEDLDKRYNAGIDAQKAAADKFNEQLKIFRAKHGIAAGKAG